MIDKNEVNNKNIIKDKKEEERNIINEKLINNIDNKKVEENINIINQNNNISHNNLSDESTAISSIYYSKLYNDIRNEENKHNEENMIAPSPVVKVIKNYDDIIINLLMKCIIILSTNENKNDNYFIYENIFYGKYGIELTYDKLIELKGMYIQIQNVNNLAKNFILFLDFLKQFEDSIKKKFLYNYKLNFKLQFTKELYNNNTNSNIDNITCIYEFYEPINNTVKTYKEENILIDGINSNLQGFVFMLSDINSDIYKNIEYKNYNPKNQIDKIKLRNENKNIYIFNSNEDQIDIDMSKNNENKIKELKKQSINIILEESTKMNSYYDNLIYGINASKYSIIEFIKIIGNHENSANFITEIDYNYCLSGGCEKTLILYEKMKEKIKIKDLYDWAYKVINKINYNEKNNEIQLICCTNNELIILYIDKTTFRTNIKKYQLPIIKISNCIEMNENNMIVLGHGGASYFIDLFNKNKKEYKISEKTFRGGIRINDQTVALTSNSVLPNGEDILIFYNIKTKKITNIIEGYSFTISTNNLALISREEIKTNNKILLCACQKYNKNKKNGILLVNPNLDNNKRMENEFYDTNNFIVYCFCPILKFEKNNNKIEMDNKKQSKIINSNYFFVGGYDLDKEVGKIKLYKIIYGEQVWKTTIKYIQDIEIDENDKFEDFKGPISCIIQSKATGHIIATCSNGNVYLFTSPNMEFYSD